ncbi:nineteen complex-related protein 2-domain-containing protein [Dactylonectria estremocensis]|uniref:Nineteen complex-related protein 2-domain-containing protein n=1 Tax=Dactylonectria estremocensis TaxID=1079267 RepID=A0A9P9F953_9HYPO|nr:nineteen complex-related protein 2-domain-containing protein [Dactylonectria estremocensis]
MSSFGAKRKAKVIKVADDEDATEQPPNTSAGDATQNEPPKLVFGSKTGRKPLRSSGLRKSFNLADSGSLGEPTSTTNDGDDDGPVVVRPAISRSSSLKNKKRPNKSSRLSFGGDDPATGDDENAEVFTPKKVPLGQRALENSAVKRGISSRGLPMRSLGDDDDRPKYSKEYLNELQSSTPNTPQKIASLSSEEVDAMDLDVSELDGALVVDSSDLGASKPSTTILTETEIREKKERRARLALEQDFLSVEDDEDDFGRKKKDDTRLIAEDEDLGEGFDNYVEDGGLSLGKKAEKERRKYDRRQMAELITAAEGHTSDSSADSDAERRIAYEAAQTRAGMDGLKKPRKTPAHDLPQVPAKISPLPSLTECLSRLQTTLKGMEADMKGKQARAAQLKQEREEIVKREEEVQALLDETGRKYKEAMGSAKIWETGMPRTAPAELAGARGLESLGTPSRKPEDDDEVS